MEPQNITQEIKIEKIDLLEEQPEVSSIENNAANLLNVFKANTVFKNIEDNEKESTKFKDRK